MTELTVLGILVLIVSGMLGAFHLGSRKSPDGTLELPKNYDISEGDMNMPLEPTEEEYQKALKSWKINGYEENPESETG
jgi:hypothetical protein